MIYFLKNAHYNVIKYYRKKINSLLEHGFKLTSCEVLSISVKMDIHIYKHMKLDNMTIKPTTLYNVKFKSKK